MNNNGNRAPIVEALIFSSPEPLPASKIINILQKATASEIDNIVAELNEKYLMNDASYRIRKIAGGYQIYITENYAGYVEELFTRRRTQKLTRPALETLAIIAYRQPVTRVDIEMIRGVSSDSAIRTLLERKFVTLSGRAKTIGRPLLYSTTDEFLKYFSLNSLDDLPKMEEIEELLSEKEPSPQPMLALEMDDDSTKNNSLPYDDEETDMDELDIEKTDELDDTAGMDKISDGHDIISADSIEEKIDDIERTDTDDTYSEEGFDSTETENEKETVNAVTATEDY